MLLLGAASGCRRAVETNRAPTSASVNAGEAPVVASERLRTPRPPPSDAPNRLPEDPVKAQAATEQWNRHLAEEEKERQEMLERARSAKPDR